MAEADTPADASPDLLTHALAAHDAGLSILPPREDGSKQPDADAWRRYQGERLPRDEVARLYAGGLRTGIGYVCGPISGNLECLEFDDHPTYHTVLEAAEAVDLGELVARIRDGYEELTPGGGVHWLVRCPEVAGNTVLAKRERQSHERRHPEDRWQVLIETRGTGGYVVAAPSSGNVHPCGTSYVLQRGGPATIATLTPEERTDLWALARTFDQTEPREVIASRHDATHQARPGDAFAQRTDWRALLEPHGWDFLFKRDRVWYLRRPGKERGVSATINWGGQDKLRVFTSSTVFAPAMYSKFAAYAVLEHDGDFSAAARALREQGYGERAPAGTSSPPLHAPPLPPVPLFPLDALPPIARTFVAAGAHALGCPPDFVALPMFAFCGAVAGNARKLRLKPGFEVSPIFWTGVVGKPGTVKTPALNHARRPLDALQKEAWEHYMTALTQWEEERPVERGARPRPEHYFATDTTTEAIAFALMSSRGLAVIHDELAGWVKAFDAYRKAGDRQTWLSAWSGSPLKPNRKTGEPIFVPDPVVCVAGGIQPEVLSDLAGEAARDDGFIPRLLLAWPDAEPSPWTDEVVDETVVAGMLTIVRALRLPGEETVVTTLTDDAYAEWVGWFNENRTITADSTGLAAGWAAKAPVHLARIALVLHLLGSADQHDRPLAGDTLRDGITILEYFRAHLGRVLPAFGATVPAGSAGLAARILGILTRALPDGVGRAELGVKLGGHEPSEAVGTALLTLAARAQAQCRTVSSGGRPREEWRAVGVEKDVVRDKGKDVESPPNADLSRFHVITHEPEPEPDSAWERWEEAL